jgi:hypothetical protein
MLRLLLAMLAAVDVRLQRLQDTEEFCVYAIGCGQDLWLVSMEGEGGTYSEGREGAELIHARTIPSLLKYDKSSKEIDEMLAFM